MTTQITLEQLRRLAASNYLMVNINTLESAVLNEGQRKFVAQLRTLLEGLHGDQARMYAIPETLISHIMELPSVVVHQSN